MSFAIIRNTKYKRENLKGIYRHNERKNKNYSNDNIDKERSYLNYSIKSPKYRYDKEFDMMKEKYNLKGQIKTVSNIACEYIITSDKQFFEEIGEEETITLINLLVVNFGKKKIVIEDYKTLFINI